MHLAALMTVSQLYVCLLDLCCIPFNFGISSFLLGKVQMNGTWCYTSNLKTHADIYSKTAAMQIYDGNTTVAAKPSLCTHLLICFLDIQFQVNKVQQWINLPSLHDNEISLVNICTIARADRPNHTPAEQMLTLHSITYSPQIGCGVLRNFMEHLQTKQSQYHFAF